MRVECSYLKLCVASVHPLGIIRHTIDISERFNPSLDITSIIQNTAIAIHEVDNRLLIVIVGRIPEYGFIPCFEIRVSGDKTRESGPFVSRGDKTWAV